MRLQFGERHFDRVEVGGVFGQKQEPGPLFVKRLRCAGALVNVQIVQDDNISRSQGRGELRFYVGVECRAVQRTGDDPRSHQPVAAQTGNECLGLPFSVRRLAGKPVSAQAASAQRGHVGLHAGFIHKDEPPGLTAHAGLAVLTPFNPRRFHIAAFFLRGQQRFFYK